MELTSQVRWIYAYFGRHWAKITQSRMTHVHEIFARQGSIAEESLEFIDRDLVKTWECVLAEILRMLVSE